MRAVHLRQHDTRKKLSSTGSQIISAGWRPETTQRSSGRTGNSFVCKNDNIEVHSHAEGAVGFGPCGESVAILRSKLPGDAGHHSSKRLEGCVGGEALCCSSAAAVFIDVDGDGNAAGVCRLVVVAATEAGDSDKCNHTMATVVGTYCRVWVCCVERLSFPPWRSLRDSSSGVSCGTIASFRVASRPAGECISVQGSVNVSNHHTKS